uniref:Capsid protein n=1 Tax=Ulae virus TaxID=2800947 RepID=A0A8A6C6Q7_9VIRU|nr:MAG: capsid protein [Ulae virus]
MGQITPIVLKDGKATPIAHTFGVQSPQTDPTKPATWYESNSGSPLGYYQVTASVKFVPAGISKVRFKISLPVLATTDSNCCKDSNTPVVSYTQIADLSFSIPTNATLDNRKDLLAFATNLLQTTMANDAVVQLQPAW